MLHLIRHKGYTQLQVKTQTVPGALLLDVALTPLTLPARAGAAAR